MRSSLSGSQVPKLVNVASAYEIQLQQPAALIVVVNIQHASKQASKETAPTTVAETLATSTASECCHSRSRRSCYFLNCYAYDELVNVWRQFSKQFRHDVSRLG